MGKVRYPLVQAFMSRNGFVESKDAYVLNGVADKYNEKLYVIKRPGLAAWISAVLTVPQGAFFYAGIIYKVFNDVLYLQSTSNNGTDGTAFTQATAPPWKGRESPAMCVFNNRMWIIGGQGVVANSIWSTQDGITWAANAGVPPWGVRYAGQVTVFQNRMYFMGGADAAGVPKNDVWVTSNGQEWTQLTASAQWAARDGFSVVSTNGGIYVAMGLLADGVTYSREVWFSSDGITWVLLTGAATTPATPWTARAFAGMTVFNNNIYIYGGLVTGNALNDVWSSPDGTNWTQVTAAAAFSKRYAFATCVYNNKLWILGGYIFAGAETNQVYSSSDGNTWTLVTSSPGWGARNSAFALVFRSPSTVNANRFQDIWVCGGVNGGTTISETWYGNINQSTSSSYNLNPTVSSQPYQFATFNGGTQLLIKNQSNFWVFSSGTLVKNADPNYPPTTVPGIVVLNQFAYVMTPEKEIHSCGLNDPSVWPPLQYTVAGYDDDPGVDICKYLNYLVVHGQKTTMYYYDNANPPPGISISPYINANQRIGCANAKTVVNSTNSVFFVGQGSAGDIGVYMLEGVVPKQISTTWIDRVLQKGDTINSAFILAVGGHNFYCLQTTSYSLVYDIDMGWWSVWTDTFGTGCFPAAFCVSDTSSYASSPYCISNNGSVFVASFNVFSDSGIGIPLVVQTDKIDDGKMVRKFWGKLDWVADQATTAGTNVVTIETTDNDYQTYTIWGTIDESSTRPSLNRGGSSRRRAFQVIAANDQPERWEAIELTYTEGES